MTKTTTAGVGLIMFAIALCINNSMNIIADLHNWHDATTPAIVAAIFKEIANVVMAAVGGTMLPQPNGDPK